MGNRCHPRRGEERGEVLLLPAGEGRGSTHRGEGGVHPRRGERKETPGRREALPRDGERGGSISERGEASPRREGGEASTQGEGREGYGERLPHGCRERGRGRVGMPRHLYYGKAGEGREGRLPLGSTTNCSLLTGNCLLLTGRHVPLVIWDTREHVGEGRGYGSRVVVEVVGGGLRG